MSASRMRRTWLAVGCMLALGMGAAAHAQPASPKRVDLSLMVSHVSPKPGPVDPGAIDIHRRLREEFHYESLRILERHRMNLRLQEIGGVVLPTGKRVELRPLSFSPSGVLIAVDIPGTLQTDVRVPNRKMVVIGVDRFEDGKLIVTLEPNY